MKFKDLFFLTILFTASALSAQSLTATSKLIDKAKKEVGEITPKALYEMIDDDDDLVLLDVREGKHKYSGEIYADEHLSISRGNLEFVLPRVLKDKNIFIVTYCLAGNRSALAAQTLKHLGYKNVRNLKGGLKAWAKAGNPIETRLGALQLIKEEE
ncbi:MAG: sulfurtransferase [Helicobacteraceae bacterium]|nr:sulfurtransferase [Candidatus Sulfurimonas ponti]MBL6973783.1 sulfurtransferase [Sulfurimonas sp.]